MILIFADELDVGCESQRGMKMTCKVFSMKRKKVVLPLTYMQKTTGRTGLGKFSTLVLVLSLR